LTESRSANHCVDADRENDAIFNFYTVTIKRVICIGRDRFPVRSRRTFDSLKMEIIIYRHAEPIVSANEIISGQDFALWVHRYNESGIFYSECPCEKEEIVYTSDLKRSLETGRLIGNHIIPDSIFREAEVPLIKFPSFRLKAKVWLAISRSLWLLGLSTKCESFKEAKHRAKRIVERIEALQSENKRVVIIGHGFLNRLIRNELMQQGWFLEKVKAENGFLSRMSFKTEPDA
jgi:broad specificity phosphatase PhoE